MRRRKKTNDAIPSWSGFNYQGKVTLFYVLQLINQKLESGFSIDNFCIELEKKEDFVIYHGNSPVSFHQVKATLSKNKLVSYSKAIDKMILRRDALGQDGIECCLITASQIIDWDVDNNIYKDKITLFKYNNNHIDIITVPELIKEQLIKYDSSMPIEIVYYELCELIDEKVAEFHDIGTSSKYRIQFGEIIERIENSITKLEVRVEAEQKENVYRHITSGIKSALNEYCLIKCSKLSEQCDNDCGAKKHFGDLIT